MRIGEADRTQPAGWRCHPHLAPDTAWRRFAASAVVNGCPSRHLIDLCEVRLGRALVLAKEIPEAARALGSAARHADLSPRLTAELRDIRALLQPWAASRPVSVGRGGHKPHNACMRAPHRRRPLRRAPGPVPSGIDLEDVIARVTYVGSGEHKTSPSFAGSPHPRADASKCDPHLADQDELTDWLRQAIREGRTGGQWEGNFPRYVWHKVEQIPYEARLVNRELGQYKGYPLAPDEWPDALDESTSGDQ